MAAAGFTNVAFQKLTGGIAASTPPPASDPLLCQGACDSAPLDGKYSTAESLGQRLARDYERDKFRLNAVLRAVPRLKEEGCMTTTSEEKQHAHELVERLDASQVPTAVRFLEFMLLHPLFRALATAPVDDEPVTSEEREAIARSEAWFQENKGKGIPFEDVLADFGLTTADLHSDPDKRDVQD